MPRQKRDNVEYFPHYTNERNDRRMKVVERRHGIAGYAVFNKLREAIGEASNLQIEDTPAERKLLAGDFGVSYEEFNSILETFADPDIDYFQIVDGYIVCAELFSRLKTVFDKRRRASESYEASRRRYDSQEAGRWLHSETDTGVSVSERNKSPKNTKKKAEKAVLKDQKKPVSETDTGVSETDTGVSVSESTQTKLNLNNSKRVINNSHESDPASVDSGKKKAKKRASKPKVKPEKKPPPPEALRLADLLYQRIVFKNKITLPERKVPGGKTRLPDLEAWATVIEQINRLDGESWEEIEAIIEFAQGSNFWRTNILSGSKLRVKYFTLKAQKDGNKERNSEGRGRGPRNFEPDSVENDLRETFSRQNFLE